MAQQNIQSVHSCLARCRLSLAAEASNLNIFWIRYFFYAFGLHFSFYAFALSDLCGTLLRSNNLWYMPTGGCSIRSARLWSRPRANKGSKRALTLSCLTLRCRKVVFSITSVYMWIYVVRMHCSYVNISHAAMHVCFAAGWMLLPVVRLAQSHFFCRWQVCWPMHKPL